MTLSDRPHLSDLGEMPVGELAGLSAEVLALLQEEAESAIRNAKAAKERLDAALTRKYDEVTAEARREQGKDTGEVRFVDGCATVVADVPKRVDWDQARLAALVERIRTGGDDPADYIEAAFKVSERKFAAWPANIRSRFEAARTVRTGKPCFTLKLNQTP